MPNTVRDLQYARVLTGTYSSKPTTAPIGTLYRDTTNHLIWVMSSSGWEVINVYGEEISYTGLDNSGYVDKSVDVSLGLYRPVGGLLMFKNESVGDASLTLTVDSITTADYSYEVITKAGIKKVSSDTSIPLFTVGFYEYAIVYFNMYFHNYKVFIRLIPSLPDMVNEYITYATVETTALTDHTLDFSCGELSDGIFNVFSVGRGWNTWV